MYFRMKEAIFKSATICKSHYVPKWINKTFIFLQMPHLKTNPNNDSYSCTESVLTDVTFTSQMKFYTFLLIWNSNWQRWRLSLKIPKNFQKWRHCIHYMLSCCIILEDVFQCGGFLTQRNQVYISQRRTNHKHIQIHEL